jgi:N-formylglutamate amidohydrolase
MWMIAYRSARHVGRHRGTLPVVLACPHDGGAALPVPERSGSGLPPRCHFTKSRDFQATAITTGIGQRLLELRGEAPYVVFAEFHRKYADVNRSADCAYEAAAARPYYEEYHRTLRGFVDEVRAESGGRGLLFDIHGTACIASDPADLYLATTAGRSAARPIRIDGLGRLLSDAGYIVSPNPPTLGGHHTLETYGRSRAEGIDAIQIEIVAALRASTAKRGVLIDDLARAIASLVDNDALDGGARS